MNREEAVNWAVLNIEEWPYYKSGCELPDLDMGWYWNFNTLTNDFSLYSEDEAATNIHKNDWVWGRMNRPTQEAHTITPKQQDSIDIIMDSFNFRKVDKVMRKLKWTWALEGDVHDDTKTPTEAAIRRAARRILKSAIHNGSADSGGLLAEYDKEEEELILKFVLEEWRSDGSE